MCHYYHYRIISKYLNQFYCILCIIIVKYHHHYTYDFLMVTIIMIIDIKVPLLKYF